MQNTTHQVTSFECPLDAIAFIDTLSIQIPIQDMEKFRMSVPALGQKAQFHKSRRPGYKRMDIHLPQYSASTELLDQLVEYQKKSELTLSRVDVAFDVMCDSEAEADNLKRWMFSHYRLRWPGTRSSQQYRDTLYLSDKAWNDISFSVYSDKLSKITGQRCTHVELRIKGAAKVRACKIDSIEALKTLDLTELLYGRLRFEELDVEALGRIIRNRPKAKKPDIHEIKRSDGKVIYGYNRDLRAGGLHARLCAYACLELAKESARGWHAPGCVWPVPPIMAMRKWLNKRYPGLRIDNAFRPLPVREILNIRCG